jgi:hypothetical protein
MNIMKRIAPARIMIVFIMKSILLLRIKPYYQDTADYPAQYSLQVKITVMAYMIENHSAQQARRYNEQIIQVRS